MRENLHIKRFLSTFLPSSTQRKLVILTGARQTGKTTLAQDFYRDLRYFNLDAPENREFVQGISSMHWHRDIGNVVIDEAQKEPVVFEKIKFAYDAKAIDFSVLLGSSQILLLKKIRESLAGRVSIYEIWPLMFAELFQSMYHYKTEAPIIDRLLQATSMEGFFDHLPDRVLPQEEQRLAEVKGYLLQWGGMPALLPLSDDDRRKWLRDYEYTYLERDLSDLARLDDLEPFKKFQRLASLRSSQLLNFSQLARDSGVSVSTAQRYIEYLRFSYQVVLLQPFYENITSAVVKTPKLFWLDVGLMRQLSGNFGLVDGRIYETMVVGEIIKWIKTAGRDVNIYFYRTRSGMEIDLLIETSHGIWAIEIKSRDNVVESDAMAMRELSQKIKKKWLGGIVVYDGKVIKPMKGKNIWAIPTQRLLTL